MFDSLVRLVSAPVRIVDATLVKPVADLADMAASVFEEEEE